MLGLISWNEFSENSYVEPSKHYGYQSLDVLAAPCGRIPASGRRHRQAPGLRPTFSPWPNILRLTGFAFALVVGSVTALIYPRRRQSHREQASRPPH